MDDSLRIDGDLDGSQAVALAGPGHARASLDLEERTVRGADDVRSLRIEEAIGCEVERGAEMRASVLVAENLVAGANKEDLPPSRAGAEYETLAAILVDFVDVAEPSAHALVFPILQMVFHWAAVIGMTDRRDCLINAMSSSFGSALISARETGCVIG